MNPIRVYLDEDVHSFIARALRLRGWEAMTVVESGRQGETDSAQLQFAIERDFAVLTYNVGDFARLHAEVVAQGNHHAGVILATQDDPRRNLRALFNLLSTCSAEELRDQLVYLNNWA